LQSLVIRIAVNALALWVAAEIIGGITLEEGFVKILLVAVIFGVVNAVVKPIAKLLTLPAIILTIGLFTLVINAVMLLITDWLTDALTVDGFGTALLGAIVISIVSNVRAIMSSTSVKPAGRRIRARCRAGFMVLRAVATSSARRCVLFPVRTTTRAR